MSGDFLEVVGTVLEVCRGGMFRVAIGPPLSRAVLCRPKGRLARFNIRILAGDTVSCDISPFDTSKGFIVYRGQRPARQGAA